MESTKNTLNYVSFELFDKYICLSISRTLSRSWVNYRGTIVRGTPVLGTGKLSRGTEVEEGISSVSRL